MILYVSTKRVHILVKHVKAMEAAMFCLLLTDLRKRVSGILCDRRISLRVKGKVYKTVVRPAMMYGAEAWAVKKAQEKKLDVAEMRMLRWMI